MSEKIQSKERSFWFYAALGIAALLGIEALTDSH
jgi:hypothetical protein